MDQKEKENKDSNNFNIFARLPSLVLDKILEHSSFHALLTLRLVCRDNKAHVEQCTVLRRFLVNVKTNEVLRSVLKSQVPWVAFKFSGQAFEEKLLNKFWAKFNSSIEELQWEDWKERNSVICSALSLPKIATLTITNVNLEENNIYNFFEQGTDQRSLPPCQSLKYLKTEGFVGHLDVLLSHCPRLSYLSVTNLKVNQRSSMVVYYEERKKDLQAVKNYLRQRVSERGLATFTLDFGDGDSLVSQYPYLCHSSNELLELLALVRNSHVKLNNVRSFLLHKIFDRFDDKKQTLDLSCVNTVYITGSLVSVNVPSSASYSNCVVSVNRGSEEWQNGAVFFPAWGIRKIVLAGIPENFARVRHVITQLVGKRRDDLNTLVLTEIPKHWKFIQFNCFRNLTTLRLQQVPVYKFWEICATLKNLEILEIWEWLRTRDDKRDFEILPFGFGPNEENVVENLTRLRILIIHKCRQTDKVINSMRNMDLEILKLNTETETSVTLQGLRMFLTGSIGHSLRELELKAPGHSDLSQLSTLVSKYCKNMIRTQWHGTSVPSNRIQRYWKSCSFGRFRGAS